MTEAQYSPADRAAAHRALIQAQQQFDPALKTATNPHFKSKYAALDACVEAVQPALNANGLFLMQRPGDAPNGVSVQTIFLHESGVEIDGGTVVLPAAKQDPQGFGSALTYARRYGLLAACGVAPENDDDGNAAVESVKAFANQAARTSQALANAPQAPTVIAGGKPSTKTNGNSSVPVVHANLDSMSVEQLREQMNTLAAKAKGTPMEATISSLIKDSAAAGAVSRVSDLPKEKFLEVVKSAQQLVSGGVPN